MTFKGYCITDKDGVDVTSLYYRPESAISAWLQDHPLCCAGDYEIIFGEEDEVCFEPETATPLNEYIKEAI